MKKYNSVNEDFLTKIQAGCQKITDNVAITLGPKGRNVVMREEGVPPVVTKDGVTVARFVELEDEFEDLAAQILKQASIETVNRAGDGTTTSLVLANGIVQESAKWIMTGESPVKIKNDLENIARELIDAVNKISIPIDSKQQVKNIATISVNGDEVIGNLIADAVDAVGKAGSIIVEESKEMDSVLDFIEGFRIDSGYYGPSFINNPRMNMAKLENPLVLVSDLAIKDFEEFKQFLALVGETRRPLVVIANEIDEKPLAIAIAAAKNKGRLVVLRPPRYGQERKEILKDLAVSLGATYISTEDRRRLSSVKLGDLGSCETMEAGLNSTLFTGCEGAADDIDERMEQLESEIGQTSDDTLIMRLQERITRLSAGVAVVKIGGLTQVDVTERRHRVEDALEAVKMATTSGVVPGGAVLSFLLSTYVKDKLAYDDKYSRAAIDIMQKTLKYPFKQLCENADESFRLYEKMLSLENKSIVTLLAENKLESIDVSQIKCLDFSQDEPNMVHPIEKGIIDPAGVLTNAIQNSVSAAATLITTGVAIVDCKTG